MFLKYGPHDNSKSVIVQVFFVDDPEDDDWKVVLDNTPRSKRHAQDDNDVYGPDAAEHTFDAPSLTVPLTTGLQRTPPTVSSFASSSNATGTNNNSFPSTAG